MSRLYILFVLLSIFGTSYGNTIHIVSYNLENLFDTNHDMNKSDFEYLPKADANKSGCTKSYCRGKDWTYEKYSKKLEQIKKVILDINPSIPDVLAVQEVENNIALTDLARSIGYNANAAILDDELDFRGIDVGLIYKADNLEYLFHKSTKIKSIGSDELKKTRSILAVYFNIKNKKIRQSASADNGKKVTPNLVVYVNHWPSQRGPSVERANVAKHLAKLMARDKLNYGDNIHIVATGDFNTLLEELNYKVSSTPLYHILGSGPSSLFMSKEIVNSFLKGDIKGSYYYTRKCVWNPFDYFLVSNNLSDKKGLEIVANSYKIHNDLEYITRKWWCDKNKIGQGNPDAVIPKRYSDWNNPKVTGYSDHFPVSIKLKFL